MLSDGTQKYLPACYSPIFTKDLEWRLNIIRGSMHPPEVLPDEDAGVVPGDGFSLVAVQLNKNPVPVAEKSVWNSARS